MCNCFVNYKLENNVGNLTLYMKLWDAWPLHHILQPCHALISPKSASGFRMLVLGILEHGNFLRKLIGKSPKKSSGEKIVTAI